MIHFFILQNIILKLNRPQHLNVKENAMQSVDGETGGLSSISKLALAICIL